MRAALRREDPTACTASAEQWGLAMLLLFCERQDELTKTHKLCDLPLSLVAHDWQRKAARDGTEGGSRLAFSRVERESTIVTGKMGAKNDKYNPVYGNLAR